MHKETSPTRTLLNLCCVGILLCSVLTTELHADDLPDLGDASATVLSPVEEQAIAEQILRDVWQSNEILRDPEIIDYLQNLGTRLVVSVPYNRQKFNFFVVRNNNINAFATFGALIFVHTGLLVAAEHESELASVLGHEIGHVVQRHLARLLVTQKQNSLKNAAAVALALLLSRGNPQLMAGAVTTGAALSVQSQLNFTRDNEREADRIGLQILDSSGFDVRAMPAFFKIMQRGTHFDEDSTTSFLRTHPLTSERIADITNRVEQMPHHKIQDSVEFQYVRAKLMAMSGSTTLQQFTEDLSDKRYTSESTARYGLAISALEKRNFDKATEQLLWLQQHAPIHPMIENARGRLAVLQGQTQVALNIYRAALQHFPTARALIYGYLEQLIMQRRSDEALRLIRDKQAYYPLDPILFEMMAQAYNLQGKTLLSHQALGEAYFYRYDLPRAVEQMEIAVQAQEGDFYQKSIVEARLKELRLMLLNQRKASQ